MKMQKSCGHKFGMKFLKNSNKKNSRAFFTKHFEVKLNKVLSKNIFSFSVYLAHELGL